MVAAQERLSAQLESIVSGNAETVRDLVGGRHIEAGQAWAMCVFLVQDKLRAGLYGNAGPVSEVQHRWAVTDERVGNGRARCRVL